MSDTDTTPQTKAEQLAERYACEDCPCSPELSQGIVAELLRLSPMEAELHNLRDEMQALKGFSTGINRALTAEKERSRLAYQAGHNAGVAHHKEATVHIKAELSEIRATNGAVLRLRSRLENALAVNKVLVESITKLLDIQSSDTASLHDEDLAFKAVREALKLAGEIK